MTGQAAAVGRVRVGFRSVAVTVESEAPEVTADLARVYRHLPAPDAAPSAVTLRIRASEAGFDCLGAAGGAVRRPTTRMAVRWARFQILASLIEHHPALLWMHGAVAALGDRAVLLPGRRGRGKSTLVSALCMRGWRYLSDDVVPLDPATMRVQPFPRVPELRRDPGRDMPAAWLLDVQKEEVPIDERVERHPRPVAAIVLPLAQRDGGVGIAPARAPELLGEIAQGCWNFAAHGVGGAAALGALLRGSRLAHLRFDDAAAAAAALERWLDWSAE